MEIRYTEHLELRIKLRNIPYELPRNILKQAKEHYYDTLTNHTIAVHRAKFKGMVREMAVTYDIKDNVAEMITIHPIKTYQKISRISSGRWKRYGK